MTVIKISKQYLVEQTEEFITLDVPPAMITLWQRDYQKIAQAKGILKPKRDSLISHLDNLRQEWER
jgi:hypothetical protein